MRRVPAILLLALICFSLIGQAASGSDSRMPACCKRAGKHHCEMTSEQHSGPSAVVGRCAMYSNTSTVPATRTIAALGPAQAIFAAAVSHPATRPQIAALHRISQSRSSQKRGPPRLS
jgi:hypothetical protein